MPRPPQDRKSDRKSSHRTFKGSGKGPGKGPDKGFGKGPRQEKRQDKKPSFGSTSSKPAFGSGGGKSGFGRSSGKPASGSSSGKPAFGSSGGKPRFGRSDSKPHFALSGGKPTSGSGGGQPRQTRRSGGPERAAGGGLWLYGTHAVRAALGNPNRKILKAFLTERAAAELGPALLGRVRYETMALDEVGKLLPQGSVHQGVAIQCEKLPKLDLEEAIPDAEDGKRRIVLVLDQITDPHNAGAILRTAAAFGVCAVVVQDRNAPPESGVLAKAASGALDVIPYIEVVNISRALDTLGKLGFWRVALAGDGDSPVADATKEGDIALVLGSEGDGVRRLVRETCDTTAYIPIDSQMESLNVSNAAAISLYEIRRG